jgi:hypothetical protein
MNLPASIQAYVEEYLHLSVCKDRKISFFSVNFFSKLIRYALPSAEPPPKYAEKVQIVYPKNIILVNTTLPVLAPILSTKIPPKKGTSALGII